MIRKNIVVDNNAWLGKHDLLFGWLKEQERMTICPVLACQVLVLIERREFFAATQSLINAPLRVGIWTMLLFLHNSFIHWNITVVSPFVQLSFGESILIVPLVARSSWVIRS